MALLEKRLDCTIDKVQTAIDRLKAFEPPEGYWLAYSGGKDSVCIKRLADLAGVKYEAHYACTSVDPPELVRFVRQQKDVNFDIPHDINGNPKTMWNLIPKRGVPTRLQRFCCKELKESYGVGRITITGVRWAESSRRRKRHGLITIPGKNNEIQLNNDNDEARRLVEQCYTKRKTMMNPIIDWTDEEVWEFIKSENVPYCELYDCGYKRLGCIGCPMNRNRSKELEQYPKYKAAYIRAFDRMLEKRRERGLPIIKNWTCGEEVMDWWINGGNKYVDPNQISFMEEL